MFVCLLCLPLPPVHSALVLCQGPATRPGGTGHRAGGGVPAAPARRQPADTIAHRLGKLEVCRRREKFGTTEAESIPVQPRQWAGAGGFPSRRDTGGNEASFLPGCLRCNQSQGPKRAPIELLRAGWLQHPRAAPVTSGQYAAKAKFAPSSPESAGVSSLIQAPGSHQHPQRSYGGPTAHPHLQVAGRVQKGLWKEAVAPFYWLFTASVLSRQ